MSRDEMERMLMDAQNYKFNVLLIEDDPGYANILKRRLQEARDPSFREVSNASCLERGLECLENGQNDVVLLDLSLPDSQGLNTFARVHEKAPAVPIVVLTGLDDHTMGLEAVREGAQDYLVKGQVGAKEIPRILSYAIERHRMQTALRDLSLIDELTGLQNRRGFAVLSEQQLKLAFRGKKGLLLFFMDMDGLKAINDSLGHMEGDRALTDFARILRETFRSSDILARIGGDEFAVLAIEAREDSAGIIQDHLEDRAAQHNAETVRPYPLSFSMGVARYDPNNPCSFEELIEQADRAMYRSKQNKKG